MKLLTALLIGSAVTLGGCNFVSHAQAMGGSPVLMTKEEVAKHDAILKKVKALPTQPSKAAPLPKPRPVAAPHVKAQPKMGKVKAFLMRLRLSIFRHTGV